MLAAARQTSQLAKILGLLLDAVDSAEDNLRHNGTTASCLYNNTLSQLSRTMTQSQTRRLDAPASNHCLANILTSIEFEMDGLAAPTWEIFDDGQVSAVLAQCETQNPAASGVHERLIQVPIIQ